MPGAADAGLVALQAGQCLVGSFAEQGHAGGGSTGEGGVDDPGFPLRGAEELPLCESDLFDQGVLGVGAGGEVDFAFKEKALEVELVFTSQDREDGGQIMASGVAGNGPLAFGRTRS